MPRDESMLDMDYVKSCSSSDCTGLMPRPPLNKSEEEWYNEVYEYLPKAVKKASSETEQKKVKNQK